MRTYIALLRGINVSGKNKVPMAELRDMLKKMNFKNVFTYIQSGNVVLSSNASSTHALEEKIKLQILDTFGFDIPVLVKPVKHFKKLIHQNPYQDLEAIENNQVYFVLLQNKPDIDLVENLKNEVFQNENFTVIGDCVHLLCRKGYGRAKLNNNALEKKLNVNATTRNYRTMVKLLEMSM